MYLVVVFSKIWDIVVDADGKFSISDCPLFLCLFAGIWNSVVDWTLLPETKVDGNCAASVPSYKILNNKVHRYCSSMICFWLSKGSKAAWLPLCFLQAIVQIQLKLYYLFLSFFFFRRNTYWSGHRGNPLYWFGRVFRLDGSSWHQLPEAHLATLCDSGKGRSLRRLWWFAVQRTSSITTWLELNRESKLRFKACWRFFVRCASAGIRTHNH